MNFSVLLSLYFKENSSYLKKSLDSIFNQTVFPAEIVLVKDGILTPELDNIIEEYKLKYSCLKIITLTKNLGLGPALNEGLKHCSYELVARMDTDDICKPNRFEKQLELFEQNPQIDIASSWMDEFYSHINKVISVKKVPQNYDEIKQYAKTRNPINHPAVMYKKSKVMESGGYESIGLLEDYFLWMKMLKNGAIFHNIQESLLFFRSNRDMYKRRGGIKYAIDECKLQWLFYKREMISLPVMLKNIFIRFFIRIIPNNLRQYFYMKFLRLKR
jgi:glycosyltransferase involved in cell wall biosynthesis